MIDWIIKNWIEIVGAVTGLLYIYFEIKQNILLWPLGIITSVFYILIFYYSKFYADMSLQFYYVFISIYGWFMWIKGNQGNGELLVSKIKISIALILLLISAILLLLIYFILKNYTDSPVPFWDALTTALSIIATWMLAKKIIEHWLIWVFVNFVSIILYVYKGLYPTSVLFLVYGILAFKGYIEWKKEL